MIGVATFRSLYGAVQRSPRRVGEQRSRLGR